MRLSELPLGGKGIVLNVLTDDEIGLRLLEMGLTPQAEVKLVGVAPLGDPLEFEVRGYRLSLRRAEAHLVEVLVPS